MSASDAPVRLELPLPAALPAGRDDAVLLLGTCGLPPDGLRLVVDGVAHAPAAAGMPRADLGDRSGFWGVVPLPARAPGAIELGIAAAGEYAPLGSIPVHDAAGAAAADADLIAICMATFEPDMALFREQVASLRAQTYERWVCVISDDGSSPGRLAELEAVVAGDARFSLSRAPERLGFYRNFERALQLAPPAAGLIALADQDDRWHPDKLAALREAMAGGALLAYSDQRLTDRDGRVLRDTLWEGRRNNPTDVVALLVANSVTGAALMMRREVAALALPFPETPGLPFHDHWIALVALTAGELAYVDRPLYDYTQHAGAFFGEVTGAGLPALRRRLLGGGRAAYFRGYLPRAALARIALARCGGRVAPAKRRALERFIAAEHSAPALAWLAARGLRRRPDTLGSELALAKGAAWRRRPRDASMPGLLEFQQERLRRWRAAV